jgi:hypothetical protein
MEDGTSLEYDGTMIIWDEDPPENQVAALIGNIKESRLKKADFISYRTQFVAPASLKIKKLNNEIIETKNAANIDPSSQEARRTASTSWFRHRMDEMLDQEVVTPAQRTRSDQVFKAYCEAKIWELGTQAIFVSTLEGVVERRYLKRPTALQLCKNFLALDFSSAECADAKDPAGKSYFNCIWRSGIFNTRFFKNKYDIPFERLPSEKKSEKFKEWLDDGTLLGVFTGTKAESAVVAAMVQKRLTSSRVFGRDYKDAFVPKGGTPMVDHPGDTLATASPYMLKTAIEDSQASDIPDNLKLVPPKELSPKNRGIFSDFLDQIRLFGGRGMGEQSVSDYLANFPVEATDPPEDYRKLEISPAFSFIFEAIAPHYKKQIAQLESDLTQAEADKQGHVDQSDRLQHDYESVLAHSAVTAGLNGVSLGLYGGTDLRIYRRGDLIDVAYKSNEFSDSHIRACWDIQLQKQVPCQFAPEGALRSLTLVEDLTNIFHTKETTLLTLEVRIDHLNNQGIELKGSAPGLTTQGKYLRLELYPNLVKDILRVYSGKMVFIDRSRTEEVILMEGNINLSTKAEIESDGL